MRAGFHDPLRLLATFLECGACLDEHEIALRMRQHIVEVIAPTQADLAVEQFAHSPFRVQRNEELILGNQNLAAAVGHLVLRIIVVYTVENCVAE